MPIVLVGCAESREAVTPRAPMAPQTTDEIAEIGCSTTAPVRRAPPEFDDADPSATTQPSALVRPGRAGISTLVFSLIIGLRDYAFALAFVVGLFSLIPIVGALVSGVVMTLLGLTVSPTVALVALVYYLAYQQFESYVIYPRIMKRSVDMPGSVGGSLMGVIGALLAVPVAAALLLLHREVFLKRQDAR